MPRAGANKEQAGAVREQTVAARAQGSTRSRLMRAGTGTKQVGATREQAGDVAWEKVAGARCYGGPSRDMSISKYGWPQNLQTQQEHMTTSN